MSLCDVCPNPGRCCSGLSLARGRFPKADTALEAIVEMARYIWDDEMPDGSAPDIGLPFLPLMQHENGNWVLWCPNLTLEGRCGDYENRPFACRHYQPLDDGLCAMTTNTITSQAFKHKRLAFSSPGN